MGLFLHEELVKDIAALLPWLSSMPCMERAKSSTNAVQSSQKLCIRLHASGCVKKLTRTRHTEQAICQVRYTSAVPQMHSSGCTSQAQSPPHCTPSMFVLLWSLISPVLSTVAAAAAAAAATAGYCPWGMHDWWVVHCSWQTGTHTYWYLGMPN